MTTKREEKKTDDDNWAERKRMIPKHTHTQNVQENKRATTITMRGKM